MSASTDGRQIETLEKARQKREAFELRYRYSYSYRDIAKEFGIVTTTAIAWVREASIIFHPEDEVDELRQMNADRIDSDERNATIMIERLARMADKREQEGLEVLSIATEIRRWQERKAELRKERALLMGLNKPVKVEHMHRVKTEFDQEIEDLVCSLSGGGIVQTLPEEIWED